MVQDRLLKRMKQLAKQIQHNDVTNHRMAIAELVELVLTEPMEREEEGLRCLECGAPWLEDDAE